MVKRAAVELFLLLSLFPALVHAQTNPEIRALWADTFHAGLRNSTEVSQLVAAARAGNFNTVIVEVRKRGDAYYNSSLEPKATDVSPQSFDPLADLITKSRTGGPRIEVHAWITTYLAWNNQTTPPSQSNHPYNLHRDWLSMDNTGANWDGSNYQFDQSHPEVQRHVYNVAMDIVSRYDVDGFHFDYVRYSGRAWGYHPVALQRFRERFNRTGTPGSTDAQWLQFRRDQVSSLVRKVYLNAIALKPQMKISAATICFAPGITTTAQWYSSSAAWNSVLQDWRGWMEEGILDVNVPMMYFDQRRYSNDWAAWSIFAKDHAYSRHIALGQAGYLNIISNTIFQIRSSRAATFAGNPADGISMYSYAVPGTNVTQSQVWNALTQPSIYDTNPVPVFSNVVAVPAMTWKTAPTLGHLKGTVMATSSGAELDGAVLTLNGPVTRALTNDATGFYGFANLPPGAYSVTASYSNLASLTLPAIVSTGAVATLNFSLSASNGITAVTSYPGATEAIISWRTAVAADSQVEFGRTAALGTFSSPDPALVTNHAVLLTGLSSNANYFFRVISRAGTNRLVSPQQSFSTAGEIIIDNAGAALTGTWTIGISSTDKYGGDYVFASTTAAAATATYTPNIATPGLYDVYVWYPQGSNRSSNAPFVAVFDGGSVTGAVNQTIGGGDWRLITANKPFVRGTSGFFQWQNQTFESSRVVMADAVRFVYVSGQEPPPSGTVPRWWAEFYFGGGVNAALDHDADGFTTAAEYITGTDPTRSASRLVFNLESVETDALRLGFAPFMPASLYELENASVLETNAWVTLADQPVSSTNNRGAFVLTNTVDAQKFYRLRIRRSP